MNLPPNLEQQFRQVALSHGYEPELMASRLISRWLEDMADIDAADRATAASEGLPNVTLEQLERELGLGD